MIRTFALALFCVTVTAGSWTAFGQSAVKESKLKGNWKLVVEIKEEADNALERVILNSIDGVLEEIDVYFHFKPEGELKVTVNAFGEKDVEYSDWSINDKRQLILGDVQQVQADESVWMFSRGRLYAFSENNGKLERENVYLERIR